MISAIVLAAGESKRMSRTKQLMEWKGKILLNHVLDTLRHSRLDEIILVLGYEANRIREKIPNEKIKIVINPAYRKGMSSSIRQGLTALDKESGGFMIVLGDQPGVSPEILNRLIRAFERAYPHKNIVLPTHRGSPGHPVLFGSKYQKEAMELQGDVGCRQILVGHPEDILEIEVDTDAVLRDLDTPEDYRQHLQGKVSVNR